MSKKTIGILGTGEVGKVLTLGFLQKGYDVRVGSRDGSKAAALDTTVGFDVHTGTFREVAEWAELVILAIKGNAAEGLSGELADALAHKIVIDVTNPLSEDAPESGVLKFFTSFEHSLGELIQTAAPEALIVKAWNSVGHTHMVDPSFSENPTMPLCGNDLSAKAEVAAILSEFGWETEDMGSIISARALEPLCMFWCIPGFLRNDWDHALKIVRK